MIASMVGIGDPDWVLRCAFAPAGVYLDSATYGLPPTAALEAFAAVTRGLGLGQLASAAFNVDKVEIRGLKHWLERNNDGIRLRRVIQREAPGSVGCVKTATTGRVRGTRPN